MTSQNTAVQRPAALPGALPRSTRIDETGAHLQGHKCSLPQCFGSASPLLRAGVMLRHLTPLRPSSRDVGNHEADRLTNLDRTAGAGRLRKCGRPAGLLCRSQPEWKRPVLFGGSRSLQHGVFVKACRFEIREIQAKQR